MKDLIKISVWVFFIILVFILQANHFLSIRGINPNLILLVIFLAVILEKNFSGFSIFALLVILLSFIFWPYWLKAILILAVLGFVAFICKKISTGNAFFDFSIFIFLADLGFYSIINFHYLIGAPMAVMAETLYNMALGILVIFVIKIFPYEKEKTRIKS